MRLGIQTTPTSAGLGDIFVSLTNYAPVSMINIRLATDRKFQLRFLEGTTAIPVNSITCSGKLLGDFYGDLVIPETSFALVGVSVDVGYYEGYPDFNNADIREVFNPGDRYKDINLDISWLRSGHVGITMPLIARVWNNVVQGNETPVTPGVLQLSSATGVLNGPGNGVFSVMDGSANDLDQLVTVGVNNRIIVIPEANAEVGYAVWYLQSGTAGDDPPNGIVRPLDYAASTNEKIWTGIL